MAKRITDRHPHPKHERLSVFLRTDSKFYQAQTYLDGKLRQTSTKSTHLPTAFKLAEDWYKREVRSSVQFGRQHPIAKLTSDPTMGELYGAYYRDLPKHQQGWAEMKWSPIEDFWRAKTLSTVSTQTFKDFYAWRRKGKTLKNHTVHKDVVLLRQVLKQALNDGVLDALPHIPPVGKIEANPRPWLTPQETRHLLAKSLERIKNAPNARVRQQRQDLQDFLDFLHASMLRVGELRTLRYNSCRVETNADGDKMLLCEVTGKRGTRTAVAYALAAEVYQDRLKSAKPNDLIFPNHCRDAFRELLDAAGLREDSRGFKRNLKSMRATAISSFMLQNPDLNLAVIARNAGTSVQMIDLFYSKRLTAEMNKDRLSALPPGLSVKSVSKAEAEHIKKQRKKNVRKMLGRQRMHT